MIQLSVEDVVRLVPTRENAMEIISALASAHQIPLTQRAASAFTEPAENTTSTSTGFGARLTVAFVEEAIAVRAATSRAAGDVEMAEMIDDLTPWLTDAVMNAKGSVRNATGALSAYYGTVVEAVGAVLGQLSLPRWDATVLTAPKVLEHGLLEGSEDEERRKTGFVNALQAWKWITAHYGEDYQVIGFTLARRGRAFITQDPYKGKGSPYQQALKNHHAEERRSGSLDGTSRFIRAM